MAKGGKRKSAANSNPTPLSQSSVSDVPKPWTKAPPTLEPFLANLPLDHIYIASLDKHDRAFKRRLFTVPLLLNIFLTILITYRIYTSLPTYGGILLSLLGYDSPQKLDVRTLPRSEALTHWLRRAMMFLGDFILLRFIGMWPIEFFLGRGFFSEDGWEAGPVTWRRAVSFRDTEIVVRRSRRWDREIFYKEKPGSEDTQNFVEETLKDSNEGQILQEKLLPAVNSQFVQQKTGYQMLDKTWDLYFSGMIEANALVDDTTIGIEAFKTTVFIYTERWGWLAWQVWKEQDGDASGDSQKLQNIKNTLTTMGKENLFFRTIEIIQAETSLPGAFTADRRRRAIDKIKEEFEEQAVDFEEFWDSVGGIESIPGLETTTKL